MSKLELKLNWGIFKNIDDIGKVISKKIIAKELEYYMVIDNKIRKVDILCFDIINNSDVFVEVQLDESDKKHADEFLMLLNDERVNNCDFVWIAKQFKDVDVNSVKTGIITKRKNINLHLITMDSDWIECLKCIEIRENHVLDDLQNRANFSSKIFKSVGMFSNKLHDNASDYGYYSLADGGYHHNHVLLSKIIAQMRANSQYLPIHLYKNLSKSRISIGVGVDSVTAILGTSAHRQTIYFSIEFNHRRDIFERVVKNSDAINNKLNNLLQINKKNNKLTIEISNNDFTKSYLTEFFGRSAQILLEEAYAVICCKAS